MAPINRAHKGRRGEHKAIHILQRAGFPLVVRSAGSKTEIDVVAATTGYCRLIQVKSGSANISLLEREQLKELARRLGEHFSVEVWRFPPRAKEPLIDVL